MGFIAVQDAGLVQLNTLLCSPADNFNSRWLVTSVACRVKDRHMEITMQYGKRTVTSAIAPDDIVFRANG